MTSKEALEQIKEDYAVEGWNNDLGFKALQTDIDIANIIRKYYKNTAFEKFLYEKLEAKDYNKIKELLNND